MSIVCLNHFEAVNHFRQKISYSSKKIQWSDFYLLLLIFKFNFWGNGGLIIKSFPLKMSNSLGEPLHVNDLVCFLIMVVTVITKNKILNS